MERFSFDRKRGKKLRIILPIALALSTLFAAGCDTADEVAKQLENGENPDQAEQPGVANIPPEDVKIVDGKIVDGKPAKEANENKNIDYNSLPGASEAAPGERCVPDSFPYVSFVMPEGFQFVTDEFDYTDFDEIFDGSLVLKLKGGKLASCGSHTELVSGNRTIFINYNFHGTLRVGYENSSDAELYTKNIVEKVLSEQKDYNHNNYGSDLKTVSDPRGFDVLNLSTDIGPSLAAELPSATYAYTYSQDPDKVGMLGIGVSSADAETLAAAKQIFDSLTEMTLTKADAERIISEHL
jgi:hypothetical protein